MCFHLIKFCQLPFLDHHDESYDADNTDVFHKFKRYNLNNDLPDMEDEIYKDFAHSNNGGSPNIDGAPNVEVPNPDVRNYAFSNDAFTDRLISSLQSVDSDIQDKILGTVRLDHKHKAQNGESSPNNAKDPQDEHDSDDKSTAFSRKIGDSDNQKDLYEESSNNNNNANPLVKQSDEDVQGTKKDQYEFHHEFNTKHFMKSKHHERNHEFYKSNDGFEEYRNYPNEYTEYDDLKSSHDENEEGFPEKGTQGKCFFTESSNLF